MVGTTPQPLRPNELRSIPGEGNTLVLGAPHISKSEYIEQCAADDPTLRVVESLSGRERESGDTLVVDE